MKVALTAFCVLSFSMGAYAADRKDTTPADSYTFQACDSWSYQSGAGSIGYICSFLGQNVTVQNGTAQLSVQSLQERIEQLEERLRVLEAKLGN